MGRLFILGKHTGSKRIRFLSLSSSLSLTGMIFDFRLQVFQAVARRLSFTKAAEELFITQPAVTKHIRELENHFKVKLFERRSNGISLTAAGTILVSYAKQLTSIYNDLEQEISAQAGNNKGTINIGASTTIAQYVLPPILAAFRIMYPEIRLNVTSDNTEQIEQALLSGDIDLGFIEGHSRNKQIKYVLFREDELVLVGRSGPAFKKIMPLTDLLKARLIVREPGSGTLEVVQLALRTAGVRWTDLTIEMQLNSTEAIKTYLLHTDCFAFLSLFAIQGEQAQSLFKIIKVEGLSIKRPFNGIYLQGEPSRLAAKFLNFALAHNQK
jgi:DNA-binding transcriptional LysR family regulator